VDRDGNIHIKDVEFPATKGLWELLTRKKMDKDSVTRDDLKQYKTILEMTNAHLEGYNPNANIHTSNGNKFRDVTSKLFSTTSHSSSSSSSSITPRVGKVIVSCHVAETVYRSSSTVSIL